MVELFIGSVIILLIVASSFYFAEKANITANADVFAENTESNCYITLNTIMQSDQFFNGKTSTKLSEYSSAEDIQETNLEAIRDKLQIMLPTSRFSLTLFNTCNDFRGVCDKEGISKIAEASTLTFSADKFFERCNYPIPIDCNPEEYVEDPEETQCKIFMEMRLNY
jgi:hypothetical protein